MPVGITNYYYYNFQMHLFILLLSIFLFITTCEHDDGLLKVSYHNERKELCIALAFFLLKYLTSFKYYHVI